MGRALGPAGVDLQEVIQELQMDVLRQRSRKFWHALIAWAGRSASAREMGQRLQRSKHIMDCMHKRQRPATVENCLAVVAAIGVPDWLAFQRLFPQPEDPAEALRQVRACLHDLPMLEPPLLSRLRESWPALATFHAECQLPLPSLRPRLCWIDELRSHDPRQATAEVEAALKALLENFEQAGQPGPGFLADFAFAVALWSDLERMSGRPWLALATVPLALDLAENAQDRWVLGQALWGAALLMGDLGLAEGGLPWLDRAAQLFMLEHRHGHLPELLVSQGHLLRLCARYERASECLREALQRLPPTAKRWRHPALLHQATVAQALRRPQEALACLDELTREHRAPDLLQAAITSRRAAILLEGGEAGEAISTFGKAVLLLLENGESCRALYLFCDFAEFLLKQDLQAELVMLAGELVRRLTKSACHPRMAELAENLYAELRLRRFDEKNLEQVRFQLEHHAPQPERVFPLKPPVKNRKLREGLPELKQLS